MLADWIDAVAEELDVPADWDVDVVLDVAKDVAHGVQRPAAPLTAFMMGMAVAQGMSVEAAAERLQRLAARWQNE